MIISRLQHIEWQKVLLKSPRARNTTGNKSAPGIDGLIEKYSLSVCELVRLDVPIEKSNAKRHRSAELRQPCLVVNRGAAIVVQRIKHRVSEPLLATTDQLFAVRAKRRSFGPSCTRRFGSSPVLMYGVADVSLNHSTMNRGMMWLTCSGLDWPHKRHSCGNSVDM